LANKIRILASDRVEGDFVATGLQQVPNVVNGSNSTTDSQWHEDLVGGPSDHIDHDRSLLVTCSDIQEDQLIGSFLFIPSSDLDRITGIAQLDEVGPFDDPACVNV
jgi:hypothetical protein